MLFAVNNKFDIILIVSKLGSEARDTRQSFFAMKLTAQRYRTAPKGVLKRGELKVVEEKIFLFDLFITFYFHLRKLHHRVFFPRIQNVKEGVTSPERFNFEFQLEADPVIRYFPQILEDRPYIL